MLYNTKEVEAYTYREMLHLYDGKYPWISNGLDIILGMKTDDDASQLYQMFLPDYLQQHLAGAVIVGEESKPLLSAPRTVLDIQPAEKSKGVGPAQVFWFLFILSLFMAYVEVKRNKSLVLVNRALLLISGIVGGLIFFLWFLSRHSVTGENFNILWAMPFNLFVAFFSSWFFSSKVFKIYLLFLIIGAASLVVFGWAIPQYLPVVVYPLCLLLISRYASWLFLLTKH